jgi:hypothetical protein
MASADLAVQLRQERKGLRSRFAGSRRLLRSRLPPYASLYSLDLAVQLRQERKGYDVAARWLYQFFAFRFVSCSSRWAQ